MGSFTMLEQMHSGDIDLNAEYQRGTFILFLRSWNRLITSFQVSYGQTRSK